MTSDNPKRGLADELHKPARKNFQRRNIVCGGFDDLWQMDLAEMQQHAKDNGGHRYILVVIDCFSRHLWTRPLKNKTGEHVAAAFEKILKLCGRKPRHLQTDRGTEFYNKHFSKVAHRHSIEHYSTFSSLKAAMAERAIRTIKTWLFKEFSYRGKHKWVDILEQVTAKYNGRKHRAIGMKPKDVTIETRHLQDRRPTPKNTSAGKLKIGDLVRISKFKSIFAKGYLPNWSTELFRVIKAQRTLPVTFLLEDLRGDPIRGCFYAQELQKTKHPDVYLVERVLRKKGEKLYVKWLGFDNTHNSWINKTDIVM